MHVADMIGQIRLGAESLPALLAHEVLGAKVQRDVALQVVLEPRHVLAVVALECRARHFVHAVQVLLEHILLPEPLATALAHQLVDLGAHLVVDGRCAVLVIAKRTVEGFVTVLAMDLGFIL